MAVAAVANGGLGGYGVGGGEPLSFMQALQHTVGSAPGAPPLSGYQNSMGGIGVGPDHSQDIATMAVGIRGAALHGFEQLRGMATAQPFSPACCLSSSAREV